MNTWLHVPLAFLLIGSSLLNGMNVYAQGGAPGASGSCQPNAAPQMGSEQNIAAIQRVVGSRCLASDVQALANYTRQGLRLGGALTACPGGDGFRPLSSVHPVAGVFVAFEENAEYIRNLAQILADNEPDIPLNVLVRNNNRQSAENEFRSLHVNLIPIDLRYTSREDEASILWMQDHIETGVIGNGRERAFFDMPYSRAENVAATLAASCGVSLNVNNRVSSVDPIRSNIASDDSENFGGNLEAFPGNVLLTGSNMTAQLREVIERGMDVPRQGQSVQANVSWLNVGHVDEVFNVVPATNRGSPCNFAILYSSPALALNLATQARPRCLPRRGRSLPDECYLEPELGRHAVVIGNESASHSPRRQRDCISALPRASDGHPMRVTDALACPELVRANRQYETIIQSNLINLRNAVAERTGCRDVQTIGVPALYRPEMARRRYGTLDDHADVINPGPVNGLVLNTNMVVPAQRNTLFRDAITAGLTGVGINPRFIDDRVYHFQMGEVHCGSNALRVCTKP